MTAMIVKETFPSYQPTTAALLGSTALNIVWIHRNAAGYGWSVNSGGVDLSSVVSHECGHVLGFDHDVMIRKNTHPNTSHNPKFRSLLGKTGGTLHVVQISGHF